MRLKTYGRNFWRQAGERAVKTSAQAVAGLFVGDGFNIVDVDNWKPVVGAAVTGFVLSIVTSIATAPVGPPDDPSMVESTAP